MDAADQIFIFLVCVLVGVASGPLYELCFVFRKIAGDRIIAAVIFDALYFLLFAAICVFTAVLFSFPDFRVYMYLGNLLGLVLYLKSIHRIVAFLWKLCYNKARKVIKRRKITKITKKKEVHSL